jgi:hypothetical protein
VYELYERTCEWIDFFRYMSITKSNTALYYRTAAKQYYYLKLVIYESILLARESSNETALKRRSELLERIGFCGCKHPTVQLQPLAAAPTVLYKARKFVRERYGEHDSNQKNLSSVKRVHLLRTRSHRYLFRMTGRQREIHSQCIKLHYSCKWTKCMKETISQTVLNA